MANTDKQQTSTVNSNKTSSQNEGQCSSSGDGNKDWEKWENLKRECKLNVNKDVIDRIKKHIEKHKHIENRKTKVDKKASAKEKERDAIKEALEKLANKSDLSEKTGLLEKKFDEEQFRLEQGVNKGSGQWEIQRNKMKGKTNVAEVISVDGFPELLNSLPKEKSSIIWNEYNKLILQKLIESLNSFDKDTNEIEIVYVSFKELLDLLMKFL